MDPQQENADAIRTTQKMLAPCLAVFKSKNIESQQIDILKKFFNPSILNLDQFKKFEINVNVRDPRDGSLCKLDNYPINLRQIDNISNISYFNPKVIENDLTNSINENNKDSLVNTVTELINSKGYKIPIPKYSPWFEKYQAIIYDHMPIFDSDVTNFAGSLLVINANADQNIELGNLLTNEERCRINYKNSWLLNLNYTFKDLMSIFFYFYLRARRDIRLHRRFRGP